MLHHESFSSGRVLQTQSSSAFPGTHHGHVPQAWTGRRGTSPGTHMQELLTQFISLVHARSHQSSLPTPPPPPPECFRAIGLG